MKRRALVAALLALFLAGAQVAGAQVAGVQTATPPQSPYCADAGDTAFPDAHLRGDPAFLRAADSAAVAELRALGVGPCAGRPANTPRVRVLLVGVERSGVGLYYANVKLMVKDERYPNFITVQEWGTFGSTAAANLRRDALVGMRESLRRAMQEFTRAP